MVIDLTKFELLRAAVRRLGANDSADLLPESIKMGFADLDPSDIVFGESGLYYVDANGVVARVVDLLPDNRSILNWRFLAELAHGRAICHEENEVYGAADRFCLEASRNRYASC